MLKKSLCLVMAVICTAITFISCSEQNEVNEKENVVLSITADLSTLNEGGFCVWGDDVILVNNEHKYKLTSGSGTSIGIFSYDGEVSEAPEAPFVLTSLNTKVNSVQGYNEKHVDSSNMPFSVEVNSVNNDGMAEAKIIPSFSVVGVLLSGEDSVKSINIFSDGTDIATDGDNKNAIIMEFNNPLILKNEPTPVYFALQSGDHLLTVEVNTTSDKSFTDTLSVHKASFYTEFNMPVRFFTAGEYYENGDTKGIVILPVNDGKGAMIMSLEEGEMAWGPTNSVTGADSDNGVENWKTIIDFTEGDFELFPVFAFCQNMGEGWFLPSCIEMQKVRPLIDEINPILEEKGGQPVNASLYYWSSTEAELPYSSYRAFAADMGFPGKYSKDKDSVLKVRAFKLVGKVD